MFEACLPLGPCVTSNWTFWPSFKVLKPDDWIAEKWANKSSPPSSGVMKPKPLESLNHLTVPVAIIHFQLITNHTSRKARNLAKATSSSTCSLHIDKTSQILVNKYHSWRKKKSCQGNLIAFATLLYFHGRQYLFLGNWSPSALRRESAYHEIYSLKIGTK